MTLAPKYLCHVRHGPTGELHVVTVRTWHDSSVGDLARYRACIEMNRKLEREGRHAEAWCLTDVSLDHGCLAEEAENGN